MVKPIKLDNVRSHLTNEEKAQREDMKQALAKQADLMTTEPPTWLPPVAKQEWNRIMPSLKNDYPIAETDYSLIVSYCLAYARVKSCEQEIRSYGNFIGKEHKPNPAIRVQSQAIKDLRMTASALGMTLEARSRLALHKAREDDVETDPFLKLMTANE